MVEKAPTQPFFRGIRAAFALLTRAPVGGFPYSEADQRWSAAHLPLVGALVGALLGAVWLAISSRAGDLATAAVVIILALAITGALHEDGLADTSDALGGGATRERVLAILKDSRIGAFGSAALTMSLLLRVALLARLGARAPVALVLAGALSRLAPVGLMTALPYVTDAAVAKNRAVTSCGRAQLAVAAGWTALSICAVAGSLAWLAVVFAVGGVLAATFLCGVRFKARVGGITGDFLGATQQVTECTALLALVLAG